MMHNEAFISTWNLQKGTYMHYMALSWANGQVSGPACTRAKLKACVNFFQQKRIGTFVSPDVGKWHM